MNNLSEQAAATPPEESTRLIPLTQGKFAIVDPSDFDWLNQWKWCATFTGRRWYAMRSVRTGEKTQTFLMHRIILNAPTGLQVDHRNGDGLCNTRINIRLATPTQNQFNTSARKCNTSGFKGVALYKKTGRWAARLKINGKTKHLGMFSTPALAAQAYETAAAAVHGEFFKK